jgi:hypothetical protein
MAEHQLPKLRTGFRLPSPAPGPFSTAEQAFLVHRGQAAAATFVLLLPLIAIGFHCWCSQRVWRLAPYPVRTHVFRATPGEQAPLKAIAASADDVGEDRQ